MAVRNPKRLNHRGKCGSVFFLRLLLLVTALAAARLLVDLALPRWSASGLPAPQELPEWLVIEAELPAVDHIVLQKELTANTWTGKTWLVKVLLDEGAEDMQIGPWVSNERNMSFSLGLGIPWGKIDTFLHMLKMDSHAPAALEEAEQPSKVESTHRVVQQSGDWGLRSTYVVPGVSVKLHTLIDVHGRQQSSSAFVQYRFAAKVQFTDTGPLNMFSYDFIRGSMELGFATALRRFGMALLANMQARPASS